MPRIRPAYRMPGLLVIAHAPLASALRSVAEHVYPDCSGSLAALDVSAGMPAEQVEAQAAALLGRLATPEVLILTDVFGATPCNIAQRLADGVHIKVVTGVNVPMLWRSLCYRSEPIDSLVGRALAGGVQGAMQVSPTRPQNQARGPAELDAQGNCHDQQ
jgi:mannose PTS system EIIA component